MPGGDQVEMLEFSRWNFVRGILNKESRENIPNGTLYILSIDANDLGMDESHRIIIKHS